MALIVCIDDNDDFREVISYELQSHGHKVIECGGGAEGLGVIQEHKPDLVVSDVVMPTMSGLELLIKVRSSETEVSQTPVILMSAATHQHYHDEAVKYGAAEYLLKPLNWDRFIEVVNDAISQSV